MGWNIPQPLTHRQIKKTPYLLWGIGLVLLVLLSFVLMLLLFEDTDDSLVWFCSIIIPIIIWSIPFAINLSMRYSDAVYNEEITMLNKQTTEQWQAWSKQQLPIFASHVICAEQDGVKVLTGDVNKIPLYPAKARPLFNAIKSTQPYWFLDEVMQSLEQQSPNYRRYLTHIYLPQKLMKDDELQNAIFERWDLYPEPIMDYNAWITELYQHSDDIELSLILTCQYTSSMYSKHSQFISALLLGDESLIATKELTAKSWLGRLMISEQDLSADLEQLLALTQLPSANIKDIWISGLDKKNRIALAITTEQLAIGNGNEQLLHDIDLTFAKPSDLTHYFTLGLANGCIAHHGGEQLAIVEYAQHIYLQLITSQKMTS